MILRVLVLLLTVQLSCSIDTITPANPLKEGDVLISVNDLQGMFSIIADGNAQISSQKSVIWSTNVSIPGMKLGLDKRTGLNRFLTSWSSINDPSPGNYTFKVDPNGSPQFFLYQGSNPVWRSGPWIGQRWSGVPDMTKAYIFNYSFVSNPDEVSVTYNILNPMIISIFLVDGVSGTVQRRTWHEDSKRWIVFWTAPKELCDQFGECGAYGNCNPNSGNQYQCSCFSGYKPKSPKDWYLRDGSQGCIREDNRSMCRNGEGFLLQINQHSFTEAADTVWILRHPVLVLILLMIYPLLLSLKAAER